MSQVLTMRELERFLGRFRTFCGERIALRLDAFKGAFWRIGAALKSIETLHREFECQKAPCFNLFRLVGIATDEVNTHSALLAELLDPRGSHGQEHLFLETFLRHCREREGFADFPRPQGGIATVEWTVDTNMVTDFGKPDLVIQAPELGLLLVIENKSRRERKEEEDQIWRYAKWMGRTNYRAEGRALIYLTPDGRESETHRGAKYYRLSYCHDIVKWLEASLAKVGAPRVRETIAQYLEVVKTL